MTTDRYGRQIPKHAHGTTNMEQYTASSKRITGMMLELFDRIVDRSLLIRRMYLSANRAALENAIIARLWTGPDNAEKDHPSQRRRSGQKNGGHDQQELSRSLGSYTVQSGSISRSKGENSLSLQMAEQSLMTLDALESIPKGVIRYIVARANGKLF